MGEPAGIDVPRPWKGGENPNPTRRRLWNYAECGLGETWIEVEVDGDWFRVVGAVDAYDVCHGWSRTGRQEVIASFTYQYGNVVSVLHAESLAMASLFERLKAKKGTSKGRSLAVDERDAKQYPELVAFLTTTEVDGEKRQTGTLNLFADEGGYKCFLNDRENELSACVTAKSLGELLKALERAVASEETDWRAKRQDQGSWAKKKGR